MVKLTRKPCPRTDKLKTDYKFPENKEALKESSFGKCMYCESKITHIDYGDVEHIKPKSIYPLDKFNWDNLGYACPQCNREYKNETYDSQFINPYFDEPSKYIIAIGGFFSAIKGNPRGQITLDIIQLNRIELLLKRLDVLKSFNDLIIRYHNATNTQKTVLKILIEDGIKPDKEYSACKKSFWEASK